MDEPVWLMIPLTKAVTSTPDDLVGGTTEALLFWNGHVFIL